MAALSSSPVVPLGAQASTSFPPRVLLPTALVFPSAGKDRPFLTVSRPALRISSQRSSVVLPIFAAVTEVDVSKVVPQADRVLIRLEQLPEKSVGGVLLPKSAVKFEHYLYGEVLSIGKETSGISVGQKVLFSDLNAYEVSFGTSDKHCFCKAGDLLAFVE